MRIGQSSTRPNPLILKIYINFFSRQAAKALGTDSNGRRFTQMNADQVFTDNNRLFPFLNLLIPEKGTVCIGRWPRTA